MFTVGSLGKKIKMDRWVLADIKGSHMSTVESPVCVRGRTCHSIYRCHFADETELSN
jgi:hypothetical protein